MAKDMALGRHGWRCCFPEKYLMPCHGCRFFDGARLECKKDGYIVTNAVIAEYRRYYDANYTIEVVDNGTD